MLDGAGWREREQDTSASASRSLVRAAREREQDYKWMVLDNVGCRLGQARAGH